MTTRWSMTVSDGKTQGTARTSTSPEVSFHSTDVTPTARWPLVSTRPLASMAAKIAAVVDPLLDRKSTRLNSSHGYISYAVFCLKKTTWRNLLGILFTLL